MPDHGQPTPGQAMPRGDQRRVGQPITTQPRADGKPSKGPGEGTGLDIPYTPAPPAPDWPPGLDYLSAVDHLVVNQSMKPIIRWNRPPNAYQIIANGGMIYWAQEYSDSCDRQCYGERHPFEMVLTNQAETPVIHFNRPHEFCLQTLTVSAPPGCTIGTVEQGCKCCVPSFICRDVAGASIMRINGPCYISMCGEAEFDVLSITGETVGKVTKHWGGFLKETFTDVDQFEISFLSNLPVEYKAVILGACILIDFMFFENQS